MITQPGRSLTADWVAFSSVTRQGVATGNVVLTEADDILYADVLSFEIDTLKGIVIDGFLDARASGFEMTGETIYKTGEETYTFEERDLHHLSLSGRGKESLGDSAPRRPMSRWGDMPPPETPASTSSGFPVIWLPWMRYPVKTDRETGFLLPEFSVSGRSGARIGLPFFWAARPNVNVIITPTYLFERGFKPSLDVEYVFGERSYGSFYGGLGEIECVQKMLQVGGILPCSIDANMKMDVVMPLREMLESLTQLTVSFSRFNEAKRFGGELKVLPEEGHVMSISSGIKTDTDGQR